MNFILDLLLLSSSVLLVGSAESQKACPTPRVFPSTRLEKKFADRPSYQNGEKVFYKCDEEFTPLRGSRSVQCANGKWTPLTLKCQKKSCGDVGELLWGRFRYEGDGMVGTKVYAECNEGYLLKGPKFLICTKLGWIGKLPSCVEAEISCPTPIVSNSVVGAISTHRVGEDISFTCAPGFRLEGAALVTCGADGQWFPEPPCCLPDPDQQTPVTDDAGGCKAPPNVYNSSANLADKYITRTSFLPGEKVYYRCDIGFQQAGGRRDRQCVKGSWTPLLLQCEPKLCGSAGEISNGRFTYTGVAFGDTATAACDEGYSLVGRAKRYCMNDGWSGHLPTCEAAVCPDPPEVPNALRVDLMAGPHFYRSVVFYKCKTSGEAKEMWCREDGTWSAPPKCKEISCPPPGVANASWTRYHIRTFRPRDSVSVACNRGFAIVGQRTITCGDGGLWLPGLPKCRRKSWNANRLG